MYVISTTDFFYPLVEDPYAQGMIACANVCSDMYAMGVYDIDNLLMLLAASTDMIPKDRDIVTKAFMKGFDDQATAAGTIVSGGQTVLNPWPIIGGVAKSVVKLHDVIMPRGAIAGDVIVLTKPLGTQVAVNVKQWMTREGKWPSVADKISIEEGNRAYHKAMRQMARLNRTAARCMHKYGVHAATDVTGFGLLGHANNLASNQTKRVHFRIHTLPVIRSMVMVNNTCWDFKLMTGYSAETSGGIFACLPANQAAAFCEEVSRIDGEPAWIIGDVLPNDSNAVNRAHIIDAPKIIEV